jgi:diaminopimelate decarboxylase
VENGSIKVGEMKLSKDFLDKVTKEQESDSFYILDANRFKENFDNLLGTFKQYYQNTNIAYSYKTDYVPRFCSIIDEKGGYAEVVSRMEMDLALKVGVSEKNIYFNGPVKGIDNIEFLLLKGGKVNVDSLEELNQIVEMSKKHIDKKFNIGIRCSFNINDGVVSRFGFDIDGEEFEEAISIINKQKNINLVGLHCHFATRSLDSWKNRTKGMLNLIETKFANHEFEYISLGGGLSGDMPEEMKKQFSSKIPTFKEYAQVSAKPFSEYFAQKSYKPLLIIEPGTALVANAMKFVTQVKSIKCNQKQTIATLSGSSYNINPKANRVNFSLPIEIFSDNKNRKEYSDIMFAGYTCIESDYLYAGYSGKLAVGDFIVFDEVGSYSIVMKPPFINPNVPIVEILEDNMSYRLIKRKETFDDIFHTYNF